MLADVVVGSLEPIEAQCDPAQTRITNAARDDRRDQQPVADQRDGYIETDEFAGDDLPVLPQQRLTAGEHYVFAAKGLEIPAQVHGLLGIEFLAAFETRSQPGSTMQTAHVALSCQFPDATLGAQPDRIDDFAHKHLRGAAAPGWIEIVTMVLFMASGNAYIAAASPVTVGHFVAECLLQTFCQLDIFDMCADFFAEDRFQVVAFPDVDRQADLHRTL